MRYAKFVVVNPDGTDGEHLVISEGGTVTVYQRFEADCGDRVLGRSLANGSAVDVRGTHRMVLRVGKARDMRVGGADRA